MKSATASLHVIVCDPGPARTGRKDAGEKERLSSFSARWPSGAACAADRRDRFLEKEEARLLEGEFDKAAHRSHSRRAGNWRRSSSVHGRKRVTRDPARGVEIRGRRGFSVLGGLPGRLSSAAVSDVAPAASTPAPAATSCCDESRAIHRPRKREPDSSPTKAMLRMIDFVSGMTDSYAVSLFKRESAESRLPGSRGEGVPEPA